MCCGMEMRNEQEIFRNQYRETAKILFYKALFRATVITKNWRKRVI
jgi:hypothetical protein